MSVKLIFRTFIKVVLFGVLIGSQPASAKSEPQVLERSSKWLVNYDDDSCTLAGIFGDPAHELVIRLTWFEPGDTFQLILVGKALAASGTTAPITLDFGPIANARRATASVGTSNKLPMLVLTNVRVDDLDHAEPDNVLPKVTTQQEAEVDRLDLRIGARRMQLTLKAFGQALGTVHTCQRNLVRSWGFDPDVQTTLTREVKPVSSPGTWLNSSDYPVGPLSQGMNGLVRFRLDVSETGAVTGCHVQMAMRPADFDKLTCDLLRRRARLLPALDRGGKPVASYLVSAVRWVAGG